MKRIIIVYMLIFTSLILAKEDINSLTIQLNRIGADIEYVTKDDISGVLDVEYQLNKKLQDGYILFVLEDYSKASMVFYDILSRKEFKGDLAYLEATFYLAESLKSMGNDLGAREYYRQVLEHPSKKFHSKALQELLDISYKLNDHATIEKFTKRVDGDKIGSNISYRQGKVYFQEKRYKDALNEFSKIKKGDEYYMRALYFKGICSVAKAKDIENKFENSRDRFLHQKRIYNTINGDTEFARIKKETSETLYNDAAKEYKQLRKKFIIFNKWYYTLKGRINKRVRKQKEDWNKRHDDAKANLENLKVTMEKDKELYEEKSKLKTQLKDKFEKNKRVKQLFETPYKNRKKLYMKGVKYFELVKKMTPQNENDQIVIDEATLAIGRLYYKIKDTTNAIDSYQDVRRASSVYGQSLYESAWVFVQGEKYTRALYAIDLLVDVLPDSHVIPEALLLKAHLYNRMNQSDKALIAYQDVKEKYSALSEKLNKIMNDNENLEEYFQSLMGLSLDDFKLSKVLPKEAVVFVNAEKDVKKARKIVKDLEEAKTNLEDSNRLLKKLLKALENKTAVSSLFPQTDKIRFEAKGFLNKLLGIEYELNTILDSYYSNKNQNYKERHAKIVALWSIFKDVPDSEKKYSNRKEIIKKEFLKLEKKAYQSKVYLSQMKNEVKAIEKLFNENSEKYRYSESKKTFFTEQIMNKKRMIREMEKLIETTADSISLDKNSLGALDETTLSDDKIRENLRTLLHEERAEFEEKRVNKYQEVILLNDKIDNYRKKITHFIDNLEVNLEKKADYLKKDIQIEEKNLAMYEKELKDKQLRSKELSSKIALKSFRYVNKKFYELILNAEIGSLEVAWKDKEKLSKKIQDYYSQESNRRNILESEFKEILGDTE